MNDEQIIEDYLRWSNEKNAFFSGYTNVPPQQMEIYLRTNPQPHPDSVVLGALCNCVYQNVLMSWS